MLKILLHEKGKHTEDLVYLHHHTCHSGGKTCVILLGKHLHAFVSWILKLPLLSTTQEQPDVDVLCQ